MLDYIFSIAFAATLQYILFSLSIKINLRCFAHHSHSFQFFSNLQNKKKIKIKCGTRMKDEEAKRKKKKSFIKNPLYIVSIEWCIYECGCTFTQFISFYYFVLWFEMFSANNRSVMCRLNTNHFQILFLLCIFIIIIIAVVVVLWQVIFVEEYRVQMNQVAIYSIKR